MADKMSNVLQLVEHWKQNVENPFVVDQWVIQFLVGMCRRNGMDEALLSRELNRFFDYKSEME